MASKHFLLADVAVRPSSRRGGAESTMLKYRTDAGREAEKMAFLGFRGE